MGYTIELNELELAACRVLKRGYLIRDVDGSLMATASKPISKNNCSWTTVDNAYVYIDKELFKFLDNNSYASIVAIMERAQKSSVKETGDILVGDFIYDSRYGRIIEIETAQQARSYSFVAPELFRKITPEEKLLCDWL